MTLYAMSTLSTRAIAEVRAEMARKRQTAVDLAEHTGESVFRIRRLLDGRTTVSIDDYAMFCEALDTNPVALLAKAVDRVEQTS